MLLENAHRALVAKQWTPEQAAQDAPRLALNRLFGMVLYLTQEAASGSWKPLVSDLVFDNSAFQSQLISVPSLYSVAQEN